MEYKVGDTIKLKSLEKLLLEKQKPYEEKDLTGFHLKSGLFISPNMFKFLGNSFSIKFKKNSSLRVKNFIYELNMNELWIWDELCFEESPQLEFEF